MGFDEITLCNYRCFHSRQVARLAPLTLIVGDNSTGKTSFMALIRALWDVAFGHAVPDFKEPPYDLGSFYEIAHHRGGRGGRAENFEAGFRVAPDPDEKGREFSFDVKFAQKGTVPFPSERHLRRAGTSVRATQENGCLEAVFEMNGTSWRTRIDGQWLRSEDSALLPMFLLSSLGKGDIADGNQEILAKVDRLLAETAHFAGQRPFASAPVRSKPQRTYDPRRRSRDPEGDYVPMYLADLFRQQSRKDWSALKERLEAFGGASGLFDELSIKSLGARDSEPFQVQVRKRGRQTKGPWRNLADVGYGVSQVLPLVTELLRPDAPPVFLLQQPEVHLHPSAQAALGTFLGEVSRDRQLVVESHSDHLINRIRLDVRDGRGWLTPERVSVLYFERNELEVRIHSLRIDELGNVLGAPPGYGRFFLDETQRSLQY